MALYYMYLQVVNRHHDALQQYSLNQFDIVTIFNANEGENKIFF